jgi:hypothetical protein
MANPAVRVVLRATVARPLARPRLAALQHRG